jgi:hypothetical protein
VPRHAIVVEGLEKYFPPARSGWRALLNPIARQTLRALGGISFSAALLGGESFHLLWPSIIALLIFAAALLPVSFFVFARALRRTKVTGTLTHI